MNDAKELVRDMAEHAGQSAGSVATLLTITASASFAVAGAIATAVLTPVAVATAGKAGLSAAVGKAGAGVASGMATTALKETATETGDALTGGDFDAGKILLETMKSGVAGVAGAFAGAGMKSLAPAIAQRLGVTDPKVLEHISDYLGDLAAEEIKVAVSLTLNAIEDPDSVTAEKVQAEMITALLSSPVGTTLGKITSRPAMSDRSGAYLEATGDMGKGLEKAAGIGGASAGGSAPALGGEAAKAAGEELSKEHFGQPEEARK